MGQCTLCAPCAAGTVRLGCGGTSPGACASCATPAARALIAGGGAGALLSRDVLVFNGGFESYGPLITDASLTAGNWIPSGVAPQGRGWTYAVPSDGGLMIASNFNGAWGNFAAAEGRLYAVFQLQARIEQNVSRLAAGKPAPGLGSDDADPLADFDISTRWPE